MAANRIPQNSSAFQPQGPNFIDEEGCRCALQEELGTEAWRCTTNMTNVYSGQTGKWFFAVNQNNPASLHDSPNSDSNPPNVTSSYFIEGEGRAAGFVVITTPFDEDTDPEDAKCSGKNDTEASANFYRLLASSTTMSSSPCWQPGVFPLAIQNASSWNATGCLPGFFCKCASLHGSSSGQVATD